VGKDVQDAHRHNPTVDHVLPVERSILLLLPHQRALQQEREHLFRVEMFSMLFTGQFSNPEMEITKNENP
jgi:hypothetical protein